MGQTHLKSGRQNSQSGLVTDAKRKTKRRCTDTNLRQMHLSLVKVARKAGHRQKTGCPLSAHLPIGTW